MDSSQAQERDAALEDAWAAVSEAQENILAMEHKLMKKFRRFLEPEPTEMTPIEPSTSKGKNVDPRNWGDVDLDDDKVDPETQQTLLEEAAANNCNNEFDDVHLERLQLERVHQEIQNIYDKHKHLYMPLLYINTRVLPKSLHKCIWDKPHHPKKQSIAMVPGLVRISNRVFWVGG